MENSFTNNNNDKPLQFYNAETNSIKWIDIEKWERKRLFYNYLGTDFPYIILTANVDVTKPLAFARRCKFLFG